MYAFTAHGILAVRQALTARVANWTSYSVLDAEIALPRICLSYISGDPRFSFKKAILLLLISSFTENKMSYSEDEKVVCVSLIYLHLTVIRIANNFRL